MNRRIVIASLWLVLVLIASGCASGAVQFAPTPLPPDLSPLAYTHPSGAFTISVPRNWSVFEQNTGTLVSASFAPPESDSAALTVAVIRTEGDLDADALETAVDTYQSLHRPDLTRYQEQSRTALTDGTWLIAGTRGRADVDLRQLNTFIDASGPLLAVTEVLVPADGVRQAELQTAINTLALNPQAALTVSDVSALSTVRSTPLEVLNVGAWTNQQGVFFVTGEVRNNTADTIASLPVRAVLSDAGGGFLIDALDFTMGHGIPPGGFAPFSLRFGAGQPADSAGYSVEVGGWVPLEGERLVSAGTLTWQEESTFTPEGHLLITGALTNGGLRPVGGLLGMVTIFDAQQNVIGAWFTAQPGERLLAGASTAFEIRVLEVGGDPVNYIVDFQGLEEQP
jgi:hypothetical protein